MLAKDLAALISVRSFLVSSIDNLNVKLSREEIKAVQARVMLLDKTIVEQSLKMDISHLSSVVVHQWQSTEDVADVAARVSKETSNEDIQAALSGKTQTKSKQKIATK